MYDCEDKRREKRRHESGHRETVEVKKYGDPPDEERVDHECEEAERDEVQRQSQQQDDGPYEKIHEREYKRDLYRGVDIRDYETVHEACYQEERKNGREKPYEELHPLTISPARLSGKEASYATIFHTSLRRDPVPVVQQS